MRTRFWDSLGMRKGFTFRWGAPQLPTRAVVPGSGVPAARPFRSSPQPILPPRGTTKIRSVDAKLLGLETAPAALFDERSRPDFRDVFGALAAQATDIAAAVTRV